MINPPYYMAPATPLGREAPKVDFKSNFVEHISQVDFLIGSETISSQSISIIPRMNDISFSRLF